MELTFCGDNYGDNGGGIMGGSIDVVGPAPFNVDLDTGNYRAVFLSTGSDGPVGFGFSRPWSG